MEHSPSSIQELNAILYAAHCDRCDRVEFGERDIDAAARLASHRCFAREFRPIWDNVVVELFARPRTLSEIDPLETMFG